MKELLLRGKNFTQTFFSNFLGEEITIRPLTLWESDQVLVDALKICKSPRMTDLIINMNLARIGLHERLVLQPDEYAQIKTYYNEIDYLTVYHAMKDFHDIELDDLKDSHLEIHEIANKVRSMTVKHPEEINEFIKSADGKLLATITYTFHVPLASTAWDITPLQLFYMGGAKMEMLEPSDELKDEAKHAATFSSKDLANNKAEVLRRFLDANNRRKITVKH